MKRQLTFREYRTLDLVLFAVMLSVSEYLIYAASTYWYANELYIVSPAALIAALVMMRWSGFAGIHAALSGVLFAILRGGSWQQILTYGAGNLVSLLALALLLPVGKERIRKSAFLSILFALCVQLLMQLGRAGVALALGTAPEAALGYLTTDVLSTLFTVVITWIVRRFDGLFEDQKHYLLRLESERQVEGRE